MINIIGSIELFMQSTDRNRWINEDGIQLYVRKSKRLVNNQMIDFLDIASITIKDKNKGKFQSLLKLLMGKYENIYVESILNPIMCHILDKYGFSYKSYEGSTNGQFLMCDMYFIR